MRRNPQRTLAELPGRVLTARGRTAETRAGELLARLRAETANTERARLACELHDGAIQSLISLEMQVEILRHRTAGDALDVTEDLARIRWLLHDEILGLRELMLQRSPVEPEQLIPFLADLVDRFRRDTGIRARFVSRVEEVQLRPAVCHEVARVVQEALINVRKHSGARNVLVLLSTRDDRLRLVIDDDGRGFGFEGRLGPRELDADRRGPIVIKERLRSFGGSLAIESVPGRGARLEITLPQADG
jgi:two-component system sensor histidine kinase DegS